MKYSDLPTKFQIPFANSAGGGYVRTIPQSSQVGIHDGWASLDTGFPPLNFQPIGAGGVPPFGQDMNGILKEITQWTRWQNAGGLTEFDPTFSTAVGGYPMGAIIASATLQGFWFCLVDDNTQNPDTSTNPFQQGWLFFGASGRTPLLANVVFYVNPSTGSDSYDGSSATHTSGNIGPFQTLTKALSVVAQFLPGTFGATINLSAGTFDAGTGIFQTANWAHCNVTITGAGSGSTTITGHSSSVASMFIIQGPNNYTLSGVSMSYSGSVASTAILSSVSGAVLNIGTMIFSSVGGNGSYCLGVGPNSTIQFLAGSNVTWAASPGVAGNGYCITVSGGGSVLQLGSGCTLTTGAITFVDFIQVTNAGYATCLPIAPSISDGGSAGHKYAVTLNGILSLNSTSFPGSLAGTTATGGQTA